MKTNRISKKLSVWLIASGVIVLIGLAIFFLFGFHFSATEQDTKSISVRYDSYLTLDEELLDRAEDTCMEAIKGYPVTVKQVNRESFTNGGCIEFVFDATVDSATLENAKDAALSALSKAEGVSEGYYTASVNTYETVVRATYLPRLAIAGGCVLVVAFAYAAIRFRLFAGVTVVLLAIHDVLLLLALTLIVRVPVGLSFLGVVGFSLVYSLLVSTLSFTKIRAMREDENLKAMDQAEALELVTTRARKTVCLTSTLLLTGIVAVALISLISSASVLLFAIPAAIAVIVSAYSSICLLPAIYMPLKAVADKRAAEKGVKYVKKEKKADDTKKTVSEENDID